MTSAVSITVTRLWQPDLTRQVAALLLVLTPAAPAVPAAPSDSTAQEVTP